MKCRAATYLTVVVAVLCSVLLSCSTKKNTAGSRFMQSFTTRYNVYFNGEQHYKEQLKKMEEEYEDDYSDFVYVHPAESFADDKATHPSVSFDRTIEKMQKAIALHSIQKKPKKDRSKMRDPKYRDYLKRNEYNPFLHNAWRLMGEAHAAHGYAVLIDWHSMPAAAARAGSRDGPCDMVLGDRFGASCASLVTQKVEQELEARGYKVARNAPYAGGYTTEHYGRPAKGLHALQIEINRSLYMDERTLEPHSGFVRLSAELADFIDGLMRLPLEVVCPSPGRFAAE